MEIKSTIDKINHCVAECGVAARLKRSSEDASYALDRALPRSDARRVVASLESHGIEASEVPDNEDRSLSWVHVTTIGTGDKVEAGERGTDEVTIEEMPDHLRASHRAARNWGVYPHNGAERRRVSREEAEDIVASDEDGYDHIVG